MDGEANAADGKEEAESDDDSSEPKIPDGGWAWLVTFACLVINIIYDGCSYSFGILFVNLLDSFGDTKRNTALIGALFFSVPLLLGPFAAMIVNRFGYRKGTMVGGVIAAAGFALSSLANSTWVLCLTYGILSGIGMSIPYLTASVAVTCYFKKKLALASGIAESGAGLGTVIFAPFTEWLISVFGWRGALLILSGVVANIVVCGALIFPLTPEVSIRSVDQSNDAVTTYSDAVDEENTEMLPKHLHEPFEKKKCDECLSATSDNKDNPCQIMLVSRMQTSICAYFARMRTLVCWPFAIFTASSSIMYLWYDVPYVFTVDRAIELGIDSTNAALLLLLIGIVHTPGNWIYGFMGDRKWMNRSLLYGISLVLCGVCMVLVPSCFSYWTMAVTASGFAWFTSAQEALTPAILTDIFGQKKVSDAFGVIMFLEGIANLIGPFIAGLLCDVTGAFDATFIVSGVCVALGGGLCTAYTTLRLFNETQREKSEIPEDRDVSEPVSVPLVSSRGR